MSKREPLEVLGVGEFLDRDYNEEEVLEGRLLQRGGLLLVAGVTEVGKSFLVKQLAYEIATGGEFLGWAVPRPFRVLLIQAEIGRAAFQDRMGRLAKYYGTPANLHVATHYTLRLDDEKNWAALNQAVKDQGIEVLILDPMRPFHLGDENSSQAMEVYFGQLRRLEVAIVQTQHERKPLPGRESDLYAIRGSSLITDRPDTVLRLSRKTKRGATWRLEYEKIRNARTVDKPADEELRVDGHGLFVPVTQGVRPEDVVRVLGQAERGWGESRALVAWNLKVSESTAGRVMREMVTAGSLEERRDGVDGRAKRVRVPQESNA